jgi:23S rRNA pseudouridine1911/1915/1917 synthase
MQHTEPQQRVEHLYQFQVPPGQRPERLDVWLSRHLPHVSRTKVQEAIRAGNVTVNGQLPKPSQKVHPGDIICCRVLRLPPLELVPEPIPLDIVYEDEHLLVINKPPGMPTHPGIGHYRGTVVNAVLYHLGMRQPIAVEFDPEQEEEAAIFASDAVRPGIVHRLDKDTSGLLLVAKDSALHARLAEQLARRQIQREYRAIVWGHPPEAHGIIDAPIGRSPRNRKAFAVVPDGKPSRTEYTVLESFPIATVLALRLHTGRTHQIRVHCQWLGNPVMGDPLYGGDRLPQNLTEPRWRQCAQQCLGLLQRQALHAYRLGFLHPVTRHWIECEAPLPADMEAVLSLLRATAQELEPPRGEAAPQSARRVRASAPVARSG